MEISKTDLELKPLIHAQDSRFRAEITHKNEETNFTPSKPTLEADFTPSKEASPIIFARMIDTMQDYIISNGEPAELKQDSIGGKISKTKQNLRHAEKQILDTKRSKKTWESRQRICNYVTNSISILAGAGLITSGQIVPGGSLVFSGIGGISSNLMQGFECNSKLIAATSIVSSLVGLVGGLGGGLYSLFSKPSQTMAALKSQNLASFFQSAATLSSFFTNGFSFYTSMQKNTNLEKLSQLEALHTKTDTTLKTYEQKLKGAGTSFQSLTKNFVGSIKQISKANSRYTRDVMRVLTADFPA